MGKKSGPSPPEPADPNVVSAAQAQANKETAIAQARLNNINETNPFGQVSFTETPGPDETPRFARDVTLTPEQRAIFEQQQGNELALGGLAENQINRVGGTLDTPFNLEGLPAAPGSGDFSADRLRVEDALFNRGATRLNTRFGDEQQALETQLANQGITRNSDAFRREVDRFGERKDDAFTGLRQDAIAAGGAEQSRLFGLSQTARDRALQESLIGRNQPLNEIGALLSGSQVSLPQFGGLPQTQVAPTNVVGAHQIAQSGRNSAFNAQAQLASSNNQALSSLIGTGAGLAFAFSSRTLKDDLGEMEPILEAVDQMTIHRWKYKDEFLTDNEVHIGPMAEDFRDAFKVGDGTRISFIDMMGVLMAAVKELSAKVKTLEEVAHGQ